MSLEGFDNLSSDISSVTGSAVSTGGLIYSIGGIFGAIKNTLYQYASMAAGYFWGESETNVAEAGKIQTDMLLTNTKSQRVGQLAQVDQVEWEIVAAEAESGNKRSNAAYDKATGSGGGWFSGWFSSDEDDQPASRQVAANDPAAAPAPMGAGRNTLLSSLAANVQPSGNITGGGNVTGPSSPPPVTNRSASDDISQAIL